MAIKSQGFEQGIPVSQSAVPVIEEMGIWSQQIAIEIYHGFGIQ